MDFREEQLSSSDERWPWLFVLDLKGEAGDHQKKKRVFQSQRTTSAKVGRHEKIHVWGIQACLCSLSHAFMGHTWELLAEVFNVEDPALRVWNSSTLGFVYLSTPYDRTLLCNQPVVSSCACEPCFDMKLFPQLFFPRLQSAGKPPPCPLTPRVHN